MRARSEGSGATQLPATVRSITPLRVPATGERAEVNLRIAQPIAAWVRDHRGEVQLRALVVASGLRSDDLFKNAWVSYERFNGFLEEARKLFPSDEDFKEASAYRLKESYGPLRFMTWALSPGLVYEQVTKHVGTITAIHRVEHVSRSDNQVVGRWHCDRPETRLACLSRQAQATVLPTLWGMPPARVTETSCAARGDAYCEYKVDWYEPVRAWRVVAGGVLGVLAAALVQLGGPVVLPLWAAFLALGAAGAYILELRRADRLHLRQGTDIQRAMKEIADDDGEARRELHALRERQSAWTHVMEEEVHERTKRLANMVNHLEHLQEERVVTLRGYSHDLRNPLSILKAETEFLRGAEQALGEDGPGIVRDHELAVKRMEAILAELWTAAASSTNLIRVRAVKVGVAPLVDEVRRRLRALVFGREVTASVFSSRDAPESVMADTLVLDRIVDNLLTNAAKYTQRGSILVELDGTAGFLVIKVSDTGRGIPPEELARVFHAGGSSEASRAACSHGVGLSVVVQLLDLVGGRLDVLSRVGVGTTFWVYLPLSGERARSERMGSGGGSFEEALERVVRVRAQADA